MSIEASGWKGENGESTAIKLHPELTRFYARLADSFGATGDCEINLLEVDGEFIAGQFTLIVGEVIYVLKIGYDERFRKLGPGNLLEAHTNNRLHAEGLIRDVNFVTGVEWHSSWRPVLRKVFELRCYRASLPGVLLFVGSRLRKFVGEFRKRFVSAIPRQRVNGK